MRAISSLLLLALAGCTAIDNFDKFKPASDGGAGGCTPGCTCLPANAALGVPEHCAIAAANGITCSAAMRSADVVTLSGDYILDTNNMPPQLTQNGSQVLVGYGQNAAAVFCIGALVTAAPSRIAVIGSRPVVILADSVVRFSGTISLAGNYANSDKGALGIAGGGPGGDAEMGAPGMSGGHAGFGTPGAGGSGAGGTMVGSVGGGTAANGQPTLGGSSAGGVLSGFGGGGGGKGTSTGGGGGGGAGALQITAGWQIQFDQVQINATGGGGAGGGPGATVTQGAGGGGGGGSGGSVLLESPDVSVNGGCISVIGGPGGGGGGGTLRGADARATTMCGFIGAAGMAGPQGGAGGAPNGVMPGGANGTGVGGGGGGTGSYGRVIIRSHMPPMMGPGVVPTVAYAPAMLP